MVFVTETTREETKLIKLPVADSIEGIAKPSIRGSVKTAIERKLMAPTFKIPLSDITVADGEQATFKCKVMGIPLPEITWYMDTRQIRNTYEFHMEYTVEGHATLVINEVFPEDEGEYMMKAENEAGTSTTKAYLSVLPPSALDPLP